MLYGLREVRDNLRARDGKRVFYLGKGDQLTSEARDWLARQRIEILPADRAKPERFRLLTGGYVEEKPEQLTHLQGDLLVSKTHPRIRFRGELDALEAEMMLCQLKLPEALGKELREVLEYVRLMMRCEVLNEPLPEQKLWGMTEAELRLRSHRPQEFYGQAHFMPEATDGEAILWLNRARTQARRGELAAVDAFMDRDGNLIRQDIPRAMNRVSSMLYLLMIRLKAEAKGGIPWNP